jgi:hypothetical protein
MLNATRRPILIIVRNKDIYASYNVLSNWSKGRIPSRQSFPKRLQIAALGVRPNQITTMTTLYALEQKNPNHWRDALEECVRMRQWAFNPQAEADLRAEVERELGMPDWLVARVHQRRSCYVHASILFPTLEAYIDATRDVFIANVRAYQAEVAAFEAAHRKRRSEALKAERAAAPPAPARAQPPRASKRARGSA